VGISVSIEDILKNLVGVLEDNFPHADKFRPRDISASASKFMYINDEHVDRRDDLIEGTIGLSLILISRWLHFERKG
jgi:hypothetical protein